MAAAVLHPAGSLSTCDSGTPRSSRFAAEACWVFVTIQTFDGGKSGESRAMVSRSIVWDPTIFRSCFGDWMRLRGQNLVPRPPASRTAQAGSESLFADFLPDFLIDAPAGTNRPVSRHDH